MFDGNFKPSTAKTKVYVDTTTVDTVNNIGTIMTSRMIKGIQNSLKKSTNDAGDYTPIWKSTIDLWKQLGMSSQYGSPEETFGDNGHYMNDSGETTTTNNSDPFAESSKGPASRFGTGIGRALVINSPFQFNPHDDVRSDTYFPHLGRVFNEKIHSNYPIAIFEVGHIKYNTDLLTNTAADGGSADTGVMNLIKGDSSFIKQFAGGLLDTGMAVVQNVLKTSWNLATFQFDKVLGLKKYAVFEQQTNLYAGYVNDMMVTLASMMGLMNPTDYGDDSGTKYGDNQDGGKLMDYSGGQDSEGKQDFSDKNDYTSSEFSQNENSRFDNYAGRIARLRLKNILPSVNLASYDYIPFLINRNVSVSESISNSTQQNPLQSTLNGIAAEAESAKINNDVTGDGNVFDAAKKSIETKMTRMANSLMRGESGTVISGEGRISLPEVWTDSNFSKSYSMSFKFTSPYGNDLSVFENTYLPFILLFCMAMPRQIGGKTYTSPFIVRVNTKGMFSIPMGIIESMSIERGEEKNSWTVNDRPRTLTCNISIKDISPTVMMTMNRGLFFPLFMGNEGFSSYLNVLGGLSIRDQQELSKNVDRYFTKVKDRLLSIGHFADTVFDTVTGKNKGNQAGDSNIIMNFRDFPGIKQFVSIERLIGFSVGDSAGSSIRDIM